MELEVEEGELSEEEEEFLLDGLKTCGEESLGMVRFRSLYPSRKPELTH